MLDFSDPDELSRDNMVAALKDENWGQLARLRGWYGRFFQQALDEICTDNEFDPIPGLQEVPWDKLSAMLDAAAAQATDQDQDRDKDHPAADQDADDTDPIVPPIRPQAAYPVAALPGLFGAAVAAAARVNEVDASMSGTVALAAASTATSKLVLGVEIHGQVKPGTVFGLVIADSSERKTSTDHALFAGVRAVERELVADYKVAKRRYDAEQRVHERQVNRILGQRSAASRAGLDPPDRQVDDLLQLPAPEPPRQPTLVTVDPTIEGLRDGLDKGHGLVGVASMDGAVVLSGHSLGRAEGKAASGAFYSILWDGQDFTVTRANDRVIAVESPRVSMSLGVQPRVAQRFLHDEELRDQGMVNRFLVAWPAAKSGSRSLAQPTPADLAILKQFNDRCADRLRQALLIGAGQFTPGPRDTALPLSRPAMKVWRAFARAMEIVQAKGARFEFVRGMAGKAAEQAARIALVQQLFENPDAAMVEVEAMQAGVALAGWYADEWLRITSAPQVPQLNQDAVRVLDGLKRSYPNGERFSAREVYTGKIGGVADPKRAHRVLSLLAANGHIEPCGQIKRKTAGRPPQAATLIGERFCRFC
jgi:hypothetical protein